MDIAFELAWLIPAVPFLSAVLIAAVGRKMPLRGAEIGIAALSYVLLHAIVLTVATFTQDYPGGTVPFERGIDWFPFGDGVTVELGMLVDGLTAMMFLLVATVSLMVHVYSREYMAHEPRFTYFYAMLSLFTASMLVLVIANTTLLALIGWELVGICSYLLIGFYWEEKSNQDAANKAFLVTKFADIGLIVGVIALFAGAGTFNIVETIEAAVAGEMTPWLLVFGCLMLFLAAVGKSGQFPLYVWLPDAMAGPTPVSALIHAATMVTAGVFFVARLFPVFAQSLLVMTIIAVIGVITLLVAGLVALVQDDIKKVLAYSTVSQLGYMVAALGVGGYTAAIFHLFTHGFFKALLFLGSGSLIHAVHSNNMSDMGGLRQHMPTTFWTFIVGSIALAGFPLTAGFFSKDEILASGIFWGQEGFAIGFLVFAIGLLAAGVTAFYMARACFLIFWGDVRAHATPHESGRWMTIPLVVLAIGSLTVGWVGSPLLGDQGFEAWTATPQLEEATYPFIGDDEEHPFVEDEEQVPGSPTDEQAAATPGEAAGAVGAASAGPVVLAAEGQDVGHILHGPPEFGWKMVAVGGSAFLVFLLAVFVAWRVYGAGQPERDPVLRMGFLSRALVNKYWLDDIGYRGVVVPVRDQVSPNLYRFDQGVIDATVKGTGGVVKRLSTVTYETVDQKMIDGAVNGSAFSAAWWSERLRRIQSGNVQRYAGAMFAGLIVLILIIATTT